ncbi:hypothetical protein HAX54_033875 [Datura stramonium]|uniref:Uncharacterized protein n=1 Tax=Datura stramonium TaxID=4076 RepID=A0ABS8SDY6_DATST|nr:hypothetical protein [Datura stramonium]
MVKKCSSSSASRSKALVGRSAGHFTTRGGSQAGVHQIRAEANPQPEVVNGDVVIRLLMCWRHWWLIMVDFQFLKLLHKLKYKSS